MHHLQRWGAIANLHVQDLAIRPAVALVEVVVHVNVEGLVRDVVLVHVATLVLLLVQGAVLALVLLLVLVVVTVVVLVHANIFVIAHVKVTAQVLVKTTVLEAVMAATTKIH